MYWLLGSLVCLDAHLLRPGWRGKGIDLPIGLGTLNSLRTGEGGEMERGDWKGNGRREGGETF